MLSNVNDHPQTLVHFEDEPDGQATNRKTKLKLNSKKKVDLLLGREIMIVHIKMK